MLRLGTIVIGATEMDRAERFWTAALGYQRREGRGDTDWRVLGPAGGEGTEIALQHSGEPARNHPRLHVDLVADTLAEQTAEVDRLVGRVPPGSTGTAIPRIPTSSCWPTPRATASASSTWATRRAEPWRRPRAGPKLSD
jgi:catechol 2,3-dioxygenase-like lactoylglutathione lyase family enzyme